MKNSSIPNEIPGESVFWEFVATIPIASRDAEKAALEPFGTQKVLIREIWKGLAANVRQFYILKAGQVGASTILQLLTLFWYKHSVGLQGVMVADSDELREFFRDQFTLMAEEDAGECEEPEDSPFRKNNRNLITWKNGSRLTFQTAGVKTGKRLGVGRGFAFGHGTEVALWQHTSALTYLRTRFSDKHPYRLLILEGTARGRNWWFDVWTDAETSTDIHRIFLAWWMREDYVVALESPEYQVYWDGELTSREKHWAFQLKRRFKVTLTPAQWAWRRWYVKEKAGNDARLADQEMPTLPEDAWEATGESFLGYELLKRTRKSVKGAPAAGTYRYDFGGYMEESTVEATTEQLAELMVWEDCVPGEAYIIAAVPAHSATPQCATNVVTVWKATRDLLEQVAEAASTEWGLQTMSWVCMHMLGVYQVQKRQFILEVAGAGMGVLQELKRIQQSGWGMKIRPARSQIAGPILHYYWRRPDSVSGGVALQWKSDGQMQNWLFRRLKDQLDTGAVRIRSKELLNECERMRQIENQFSSTGRTCEEHRLMSAALAVESWSSTVRPMFKRVQGQPAAKTVVGKMVETFFANLGSQP